MNSKKILSSILAGITALSMCMTAMTSYAEDVLPLESNPVVSTGLCEHHSVHTLDCGYVERKEALPCTHIHDESCGYQPATDEIPCDYECTDTNGDGDIDHTPDCGYHPANNGSPCDHIHDANCGYSEAVEEHPCTYVCEICNKLEQDPEQNCICDVECTEGMFNQTCAVCAEDYIQCAVKDHGSDDLSIIKVQMDNILVKTNQAVKLSYSVPEGYEDKITFAVAPEDASKVTFTQGDDKIWSISSVYGQNTAGNTMTVNAIYNNEIVGTCQICFIPYISSYQSGVEYSLQENGDWISTTSVKVPFAVPTPLYAVWDNSTLKASSSEILQQATVSRWDWSTSDSSVVGLSVDENNSAKAIITLYQAAAKARVCAKPWLNIGGIEYLYNYPVSYSDDIGVDADDTISPVTCTPSNIYEGTSITLKFNLDGIPGADENTQVTWSSSNPDILPLSDQNGLSVTVATQKGFVDGEYTSLTIIASAVVGGQTYSASFSPLLVWRTATTVDATVNTLDALQQAISEGKAEIAINGTIALTAGTQLDLSNVTILRASGFKEALFSVKNGTVTITGRSQSSGNGEGNTVLTRETISGGIIDGDLLNANEPLITVGENGQLTLENMTLQNSRSSNGKYGGAVYVKDGQLTCQGVTFSNNVVNADPGSNYFDGGGAIHSMNAVLKVNDCKFTQNIAQSGNGGAIYADQGTSGNIEENSFSECFAEGVNSYGSGTGGAIYCRLTGAVTITDNLIQGCTAEDNGGGVAVVVDDDGIIGTLQTTVTLSGNDILSCSAQNRGGGLYLINSLPTSDSDGENRENNCIQLLSGTISGCTADWGGGIDYTGHGMNPLYLTNVVVTGNEAIRGAGIWACPTSETESYSTLGGAFYGNTATGEKTTGNKLYSSGDDIRYEGLDADQHQEDVLILQGNPWKSETSFITVNKRALGGGLMQWYQDEQDTRFTAAAEPTEAAASLYTNTQKSFSLHGELASQYQTLAENAGKLMITNNIAETRGGGIATNSPIIIGMENQDKTVNVTKVWKGTESHPDSVEVTLVMIDAEGHKTELETVELNAANNWSATFEDLPAYYLDENGTQQDYTYTVVEGTVANWTGEVVSSEEGNVVNLVLTNRYTPSSTVGNVAVFKTVTGNDGEYTKDFTFTLRLTDSSINGKYGDMTFVNGIATFTLRHGESKIAVGLPSNVGFAVAESDNIGYQVIARNTSGFVPVEATAEAVFINNREIFIPVIPVDPPEESSKPEETDEPDVSSNPGDEDISEESSEPLDSSEPEEDIDDSDISSDTVESSQPEAELDDTPITGDRSHSRFWMVLSVISLLGLVLVNLLDSWAEKRHSR